MDMCYILGERLAFSNTDDTEGLLAKACNYTCGQFRSGIK